jgi:hypothetical protein
MNYILFTGTGIIEGKISSDGKYLFVLSDKVRSCKFLHVRIGLYFLVRNQRIYDIDFT